MRKKIVILIGKMEFRFNFDLNEDLKQKKDVKCNKENMKEIDALVENMDGLKMKAKKKRSKKKKQRKKEKAIQALNTNYLSLKKPKDAMSESQRLQLKYGKGRRIEKDNIVKNKMEPEIFSFGFNVENQ